MVGKITKKQSEGVRFCQCYVIKNTLLLHTLPFR